jgi:putative addiction module component (TIGR02574 family)
MPMTLQQLEDEAMKLSYDDRCLLIHRISRFEADPEVEAAWDEEIRRRAEEIDKGEVELVPFEQVMEKLRVRHRKA